MKKLVRDRIPQIALEKSNEKLEFYVASNDEFLKELKIKLQEEVDEFLASDDLLELADILEVLYALAKEFGMTREDLELARKKKEFARGGFERKIILKWKA